jgi:hypothetical protein
LDIFNSLSNAQAAITAVERLAAVGLFLAGLEYVVSPIQLSDDGMISWRVGSLRGSRLCSGRIGRVLDAVMAYPHVLVVVGVYAAFAGFLIVGPADYITKPWVLIPVAVCVGTLFIRSNYGYDGADQLIWIVFVGLVAVSLIDTPPTRTAFLWFIAVQGCLAYGVAGLAKASARGWRDGSFLVGILGTNMYGNAKLAAYLAGKPKLVTLHSRMIVLFECSFLAVLLLPMPAVLFWLGAGVAFHVANAYVMGLNTFVWAFIATYPAMLFCVTNRGW